MNRLKTCLALTIVVTCAGCVVWLKKAMPPKEPSAIKQKLDARRAASGLANQPMEAVAVPPPPQNTKASLSWSWPAGYSNNVIEYVVYQKVGNGPWVVAAVVNTNYFSTTNKFNLNEAVLFDVKHRYRKL